MKKEYKSILKISSVLLVEDDKSIRDKFSRLLSIYVGKIYEASNGIEAVELYKKYNPSFVITDIEMPKMDGVSLATFLKNENSKLPIFITSAYSNREYLLSSIKLQLNDYLVKPVKIDELMEALEKAAELIKVSMVSNIVQINEEINYDPIQKNIIKSNEIMHKLTTKESKLLDFLICNKGTLVTKKMVEENMYIFKEMSEVALKNIVYKLRRKLGKNSITTVSKLGYMIN